MNLIVSIICMLIVLAATDFLRPGHKRLHNQIYELAFFLTWFLFSIKYYYGGDIAFYVPYYEDLPTINELFNASHSKFSYEIGFNAFCIILKSLHISYWGVTAIVTAIYFYTIHKLFSYIPAFRTLALCLLVCLEFNLIFATHRQCLAVSFFILMYFSFYKKQPIRCFLYMILTCTMHKSGMFFGLTSYVLLQIKNLEIKRSSYYVLTILMLVIMMLPIQKLTLSFAKTFAFNPSILASLEYHLTFIQRFQPVLILYLILFWGLATIKNKSEFFNRMNLLIFLFMTVIAITYQFYPLTWRIRSYFVPFLITYLFTSVWQATEQDDNNVESSPFLKRNIKIITPILPCLIMLFCIYTMISCYRNQNLLKSRIYDTCTIFELYHTSKEEIIERQMGKARYYWIYEAVIENND